MENNDDQIRIRMKISFGHYQFLACIICAKLTRRLCVPFIQSQFWATTYGPVHYQPIMSSDSISLSCGNPVQQLMGC